MIKVLIFDLDGTLYENRELLNHYQEISIAILSKFMDIDSKEAEMKLKKERKKLKERLGYKPSLTYTLKMLGVPIHFRNSEYDKLIHPDRFLKKDIRLKNFLTRLKDKFKLAIVTNNTRYITEGILKSLGIEEYFDYILTLTESGRIKPDPKLYLKTMKKFKVKPTECLVIGDRFPLDIKPALELGMFTHKIESVEEVYDAIIQIQR